MANRTTPNSYFAWYNDDDRIAIVCRQESSNSSKGTTSGEYDTFLDTGNLSGTITNMTIDGTTVTVTCSEAHGLSHTTSDKIKISGTRHYDGDYTLASTPTTTTFTITSSAIASDAETKVKGKIRKSWRKKNRHRKSWKRKEKIQPVCGLTADCGLR